MGRKVSSERGRTRSGMRQRGLAGRREAPAEDEILYKDEYDVGNERGTDRGLIALEDGERDGGLDESEDDDLDEQNVLDVMGDEEEEEDDDAQGSLEEDDDDEVDDDVDMELTGYAAKLARQAKILRSRPELQQGEEDEEEDEEDDEDEGGAKWGPKKGAFYSADTVDYELASEDELAPQEEEEEALRLQRRMDSALRPEDYEQDDEDGEEHGEGGEKGGEGAGQENGEATLGELSGSLGKGVGRSGRKAVKVQGGVEVEEMLREGAVNFLTQDDRLRGLEIELPEMVALLSDLKAASGELQHKITPLLEQVRSGQHHMTPKGLSYLESKHSLLLHYCCCLIFFLLLKAEGKPVKGHPVMARLVELRLYLEKIRPIDKRLQYQLEKLLRLAGSSAANPTGPEGAPNGVATLSANGVVPGGEEDDVLKYRPNPGQLVSKLEGDGDEDAGAGVYRPPKIAPVSMDDEGRQAKSVRWNRKGDGKSAFLKELAEELEGRPEEVQERGLGRAGGVASSEMDRELQRLRERAEAEERLFARVPLKREERKKLKALKKQQHSSLGAMLEDFEDDVADLMAADEVEGTQSGGPPSDLLKRRKLSEAIAEVGQLNHLALPKSRALASGDSDLPTRPDLAERRRAFDTGFGSKKKRKAAEEEMLANGGEDDQEDDFEEGDDEFYAEVREAAMAKKLAKKRNGVVPEAEPETDGKRQISYQMEKNRGLTPHRKKLVKNPRKKYKLKHAKAVVRRKGQVRDAKTGVGAYSGETTGIKAKVSHSIRIG